MEKEAVLNGLVLAGGKSKRMGEDKGVIKWHGKEQRYFMADLLKPFCNQVFISCRPEQTGEIDDRYNILPDLFSGAGPLGGILTAFSAHPDNAWLIVACDLPLLDENILNYLIDNRDPAAIATTFESPFDGLPEPLITIWEPCSYAILQSFFADNFTCPRKALIRNKELVKMLQPPDPESLMNANTPKDAERVRGIILRK